MATFGVRAHADGLLPSFSVVPSNGTTVASSGLSSEPRWLLVYLSPSCRSCDRLIESMKQWQSAAHRSRIVVVVRGSDTAGYVAAHQAAGLNAAWYADERDDAWRSLGLKSVPALIAVESGEIKWTVDGVLNDPAAIESIVRRWADY